MVSKSKKLARAYGRRKFQTRKKEKNLRNAKATAERERSEAKVRELLPSVLGIASGVGYNENVLGLASSLSRNTRSNYLTTWMREARVQRAREHRERPYDYTTPLINAVKAANVDTVRQMLNTTRVSNRITLRRRLENVSRNHYYTGDWTPLETAFNTILKHQNKIEGIDASIEERNHNEGTLTLYATERQQAVETIEKLKQIIQLLLEKNARIRPKGVIQIWKMNLPMIEEFLMTFPILQHKSVVYQDPIWNALQREYDNIVEEIRDEESEWNRREQNYRIAPQWMHDERNKAEDRLYAFEAFLYTQDPETKTFSFYVPNAGVNYNWNNHPPLYNNWSDVAPLNENE